MALLLAIAALSVLASEEPPPAQTPRGRTAGSAGAGGPASAQVERSQRRPGRADRRAYAGRARREAHRGGRARAERGLRGASRAPRAPRGARRAPAPSPGTLSARPPSYEREPNAPTFWRTVGHYSLTLLMAALYLLAVIFMVAGVLTPLLVLLSLWNWVRTRRLALFLLLMLAAGIVSGIATAGRGGIHWPYPAIVVTMGLVMLLARLWPRWRLLRSPLPKGVPTRTSVARGVLDSRPWPKRNARGVTTVSVLIASVMVLVVAGAGVSCLSRAAQASRSAQRSFVATTLLHGEFERLRAGAITVADVEQDLSLRASRLLPNAGARARVTRQGTARLFEYNLEVSWQEAGRPRRAAALAGLVYTGGSQR